MAGEKARRKILAAADPFFPARFDMGNHRSPKKNEFRDWVMLLKKNWDIISKHHKKNKKVLSCLVNDKNLWNKLEEFQKELDAAAAIAAAAEAEAEAAAEAAAEYEDETSSE